MISGVIYTTLGGLVNGRCYPSSFPQEDIAPPGTTQPVAGETNVPTWPAIRYTVISAVNEAAVCGTNDVDSDETTVQIDVVAKTYGGMISIRDQVIAALMALADPPCTRDGYFETRDSETKTHRGILTYQFHASNPGGVSP